MMSRNWRLTIWLAAGSATLVKLYLALFTAGTLDAAGFADHLVKIRALGGVGTYRSLGAFNNPFNSPPFMIHVLRLLGWLEAVTHVWFPFWLRLPCVAADVGSLWLVWKILERRAPHDPATTGRRLVLLALCPVSVIISGYHGNTDPVMIFLTLLAVYLLERDEHWWLAGAAFGMALNIKAVPLVFAPAIFFYLVGWRRRAIFFGTTALVFLVGSLPYVVLAPALIAQKVFGYRSLYGNWGWTYLLARWQPETLRFAHPPHDVIGVHALYATAGTWLLLSLIVAVSYWLNRGARKVPLFAQCGLIVTLFLLLAPGFGTQYLSWLVPWVIALGLWRAALYYLSATVFLLLSYVCHVFRFGALDFCTQTAFRSGMVLCWFSLALLLYAYYRAILAPSGTPRPSP